METFIDAADSLRKIDSFSRAEFDLMFNLIQERLPQLYAKSVVDLNNIESVFGLVEMGRLIGRLPATSSDQVEELSKAMRRVLAETVEETCRFRIYEGHWLPSSAYGKIAEYIAVARKSDHDASVALITFNYDLGLDFAVRYSGQKVDYGLSSTLTAGSIPLLKLHGSLNWTACVRCNAIRPVEISEILRLERNRDLSGSVETFPIRATRALDSIGNHCSGVPVGREPAIVPPSWNKTQYHQQFSQIWRHAARELSEAQDIRVFGYSLPTSDSFFRDLLALGLAGTTRLKSFTVVDPSAETAERFHTLLGPAIRSRFRHEKARFEDYSESAFF